jgi:hypothetical protein
MLQVENRAFRQPAAEQAREKKMGTGAPTETVRATDALHDSRILAAINDSGIEFALSVPA